MARVEIVYAHPRDPEAAEARRRARIRALHLRIGALQMQCKDTSHLERELAKLERRP